MERIIRRLTLVCLMIGLALPAAVSAQIPDEFTNLKLLPAATTRGEIISIMRDWAGGLGVRCNHCHVDPENWLARRGMEELEKPPTNDE